MLPEFRELLEGGLVDIVQADLTHFGGFTGLRKLAGWAGAYDLLLAPHNVCGPVGTAANVHLGIATGNYKVLEHFNDFADPWVAELVDGAPRVEEADGCFALPTAPGLGVRLDREAAARHPRTGVHFNLVEEGGSDVTPCRAEHRRRLRQHRLTTAPAAPRTAASGPRREASTRTGDHRWVIARSASSSSSGLLSHGSRAA